MDEKEKSEAINAILAGLKAEPENAAKYAAAKNEDEIGAINMALIKKAKQVFHAQEKSAALNRLLAFVKSIAEDQPDVMADVKMLEKVERVAAAKASKPKSLFGTRTDVSKVVAVFTEVGHTMSEDEVYAKFRFGRSDVRKAVIADLKKAAPADRKWIDLDFETGLYVLRGLGENAPEGWTGYVPASRPATGVGSDASQATLDASQA